jgi:glycerophosphoryl diester phosphodiesterase
MNFNSKKKPYLMAHRGNRVHCPENTKASFLRAIEDGADIIETDLHLSKDDAFICIHDASVDRTTDGHGLVAEMTLHELKKLSASYGREEFKTEKILTLEETTNLIPADRMLALELKTDRFFEEGVCQKLVETLKNVGIFERVIILSFNMVRLLAVQQVTPNLPIGWITMRRLIPDVSCQLIGPFFPILYLNPLYVRAAHRRNMFVCPLDPTPDKRLKYYLRLGCDAILSDDPGSTKMVLDKLMGK